MRERLVRPEILDRLPADHPDAVCGRRDLRRINFLMGNERWILRTIRKFANAATRGITEAGAGEGTLASRLAMAFPAAGVTACDLVPRPVDVHPSVTWRQGDLLEGLADLSGGVLVANLFLHHFEGNALMSMGRLASRFEVLIFNEPDRACLPHLLGGLLSWAIHPVTRHDLHVSIRAGFARGELPAELGMDPCRWSIQETSTWHGARRVVASRT